MQYDTIAAIATQIGNAGIAIIRVSGKDTIAVINKIFKTKSKLEDHKVHYGYICDDNIIIDEVLVTIMLAPKSYTKEDIAEINCHGGSVSVRRVLETLLKNGARLAEQGEFTKRAFLNGRIDLSQAEAVIDIINAKTSLSQSLAINQLEGELSKKVKIFRDEILAMLVNIEASIDYPEHDMEAFNLQNIEQKTKQILDEITCFTKSYQNGKIIREGIETVIIGKPNVGKSSLLNTLLKQERAIVTDIPGTTRDAIEEYINIRGVLIKIIDTAGIRNTSDKIELIGIEKSKLYAESADLILLVIDNSELITDLDINILEQLKYKKIILILNKIDLPKKANLELLNKYVPKENIISISIVNNQGIEILFDKIENLFLNNEINLSSDVLVTSVRHKDCLTKALERLENVLEATQHGMTEDLVSIDLMDAYRFLGEITGETLDEDIIDRIFSEFCLGK